MTKYASKTNRKIIILAFLAMAVLISALGLTLVNFAAKRASRPTTPPVDVALDKPKLDLPIGESVVERGIFDKIKRDGSEKKEVLVELILLEKPSADKSKLKAKAPATLSERREKKTEFINERKNLTDQIQQQVLESLKEVIDRGNIEVLNKFWFNNVLHLKVNPAGLEQLLQTPGVKEITENSIISIPQPQPTDELTKESIEWNISKINADKVWTDLGISGQGVVVANLDTGVNWTHPALKDTYRGWKGNVSDHVYNWFDAISYQPSPYDDNSVYHGTHTMGTIVGKEGEINQIGVAPTAKWIAAKFLNASGSGSTDDALEAMQWLLAPKKPDGTGEDPSKAPDVISNSWGYSSGCQPIVRSAVKAWRDAGIVPIFANGNSGPYPGSVGSPGDYPESIGVGATNANDVIASFSSRGPSCSAFGSEIKPEVSAPGVNIRSSSGNNSYAYLSGTSMAAPHVAGLAALLLSANPALSVDQIEEQIKTTALDLGTPGPDNNYGAGRIDAYKAVLPYISSGTLSGTVTSSGNPLAEVEVEISSEVFSTYIYTDASGQYSIKLPTGSYTVTFSKFGYETSSQSAVIEKDQTTTVDIELNLLPTYKISGKVTNQDGNKLSVPAILTIVDTPLPPVKTDDDGLYFIDNVPAGNYEAAVTAIGYISLYQKISVFSDTTLDFILSEHPKLPVYQDFEQGLASWSTSGLWHVETDGNPCANPHSGSKSAYYGKTTTPCNYETGSANSGDLTSPLFFVQEGTDAEMSFWYWYETETQSVAWDKRLIQIKEEGSSSWVTVKQLSDDLMNQWNQQIINLNLYQGKAIQVRFYFDTIDNIANHYKGWYIDDVAIIRKVADTAVEQTVPSTIQRGEKLVFQVNYANKGDITAENVTLIDSWEIPSDGSFVQVDTKGLPAKIEMIGQVKGVSDESDNKENRKKRPTNTPKPKKPTKTPLPPSNTPTPPASPTPTPALKGGFKLNLGPLAPNQSGTIEVIFDVGPNAKLNDIYNNSVEVSTSTFEENMDNNLSSAYSRVITPEITIELNQPEESKPLQEITSVTTIKNVGDVTAEGVKASVEISSRLNFDLVSATISSGPSESQGSPQPLSWKKKGNKTTLEYEIGSLAFNEPRIITIILKTTKKKSQGDIIVTSNAITSSQETNPSNQISKIIKISGV